MSNLQENPNYEPAIYQLAVTDPVQGGTGGVSNTQALQLANRTAYLKAQVEALAAELSGLGGQATTTAYGTVELADMAAFLSPGTNGNAVVTVSLAQQLLKPGFMVFSGSQQVPDGYLLCNGAQINRTTYAALFAVIGTNFGTGDGSTTFTLPDMRGVFPRGFDAGAGRDPGRVFGSTQTDTFGSHAHPVSKFDDQNPVQRHGASNVSNDEGAGLWGLGYDANPTMLTAQAVGGTETRPKNVAGNFYIRY